jgi:pimeloyl-ACP methyl ester carboxylesterase
MSPSESGRSEGIAMQLFADPLQDEFASWALGFAPFGGADVGEIVAIADRVKPGDDDSFFKEWSKAAAIHLDAAETAESQGRRHTAYEEGLQASCLYGPAMHIVYGAPVDPRMQAAFAAYSRAFALAMRMRADPAEPMEIPLDGKSMSAFFVPATGVQSGERRPLVIMTNGYDASMSDMYLAMAVSATQRGYHCLLFDGPGQGSMLVEQGVPLRADWENVVKPVVDAVLARDDVDPDRIALQGWSLGGYLAPRAASGEPRFAALIADPCSSGMSSGFPAFGKMLGLSDEATAALPTLSDADSTKAMDIIEADRNLRWTVVQRGFWVGGVGSFQEFLRSFVPFTMEGRYDSIRCPTLLTQAEADPLGKGTDAFNAELSCPVTLIEFTSAEGAGDHCELLNRSLANRRIYDWLEKTLAD